MTLGDKATFQSQRLGSMPRVCETYRLPIWYASCYSYKPEWMSTTFQRSKKILNRDSEIKNLKIPKSEYF